MRPKKPDTTRSGDLFRARLDQIINLKHELAQLAGQIDWDYRRRDRPALQRQGSPRDTDAVCDRAAIAEAYLRARSRRTVLNGRKARVAPQNRLPRENPHDGQTCFGQHRRKA